MSEATPNDRSEFNHTPGVLKSEASFKILAHDALVITP